MNILNDLDPRYRRGFNQFVRFAMVGGFGALVNLGVIVLCNVVGRDLLEIQNRNVLWDLPGTAFNVRYYHLYSMIAFFVASLSNFMMNRHWTFKSANRAHFMKEYIPFVSVGLVGQLLGMVLVTLLMHDNSPIGLPNSIFDDSSGLRTKAYWAQLIMIGCITPINFILNKFWTFRLVRQRHGRQTLRDDASVA